MIFIFFISFVILLRIAELFIAKSNEKWMRKNGAVEYGREHYPFMVSMHTLFFIALITEYCLQDVHRHIGILIVFYCLLIILKFWAIGTLGKFWNTRILRIPGISLIAKGPYKYVKHPNYIIVVVEIAVIPLSFHLYYTAVIFSLLNAAMLYVRIKVENKALNL